MNKKEINKKKTLVLLDAHAIIHRAYHALPDFSTVSGEPTGALYGIVMMLYKIVKDLQPDYVVACFDLPGGTFRHEAYEGYKAGRSKADDALARQIETSREVFAAFSIPVYEAKGFEADDLLGTISEKYLKSKEVEVIIASGDMDTLQLVSGKQIRVYTLKKGIQDTIMYDEDAVKARFSFGPECIADYKGLRGDPSDNIVGIKGIGEKTATLLITKFGSIESLYKKLKKDRQAFLDAGLTERLITLLEENKEEALFSKTLATIRKDAPITFTLPEKHFLEGVSFEALESLFKKYEFRTMSSRWKELLNVETKEDALEENERGENLLSPLVSREDKELLEKAKIAFWLLHSDKSNPSEEDIFDYTNKKNISDALLILEKEVEKNNLTFVYKEIELPLISILKDMKVRGIKVDVRKLEALKEEYETILRKVEKEIWDLAGGEFNINSPKQLGEVLFDKLQLTVKGLKKTEGGARSTRVSELEKLHGAHPIIEKIESHREYQKLLSTYVEPLPLYIEKDGRIHADFIQAGTTTGRFSSANPNLQNIPIKGEQGKRIREAFVADKGKVMVALDYSQIELRVAAILARDHYLIDTFNRGEDIHAAVASKVFGVPQDRVSHDERRQAKVINFGILYGMGVNALRENLGCDRATAERFYNDYKEAFPRIFEYLEEVKRLAKKNGYTETLFGRRRYFPALKSPMPYLRAMAERMAINAPIQGTAADIMKLAMREAEKLIQERGLHDKVSLLLQVHDELVYEIDEESVKEGISCIKEAMESVLPLYKKEFALIPLTAESKKGENWGALLP